MVTFSGERSYCEAAAPLIPKRASRVRLANKDLLPHYVAGWLPPAMNTAPQAETRAISIPAP